MQSAVTPDADTMVVMQTGCLEAAETLDQNNSDNVSVMNVCHQDLFPPTHTVENEMAVPTAWPALFKAVTMTA